MSTFQLYQECNALLAVNTGIVSFYNPMQTSKAAAVYVTAVIMEYYFLSC